MFKSVKFTRVKLMVSLFLLMDFTAIAQDSEEPKPNGDSYYRFGVSYNRSTFKPQDDLEGYFGLDDDGNCINRNLNGVGLEWHADWKIAKSLPFYAEIGLEAQLGWWSKTEKFEIPGHYYTQTSKMQNLTFVIPFTVSARINISNKVSIQPLIGLDVKFNAMVRHKTDYNKAFKQDFDIEKKETEWKNMLSDDKDHGMEKLENCWNVVQVGWHVGGNINFNNFYIGATWGTDFIPAYKYDGSKISSSNLKVSLGTCF